MSDEGQTAEATAPEPTKIDRKAVEDHPAFKGVAKRAQALEAKLAEMEAATKAAEEARLQQQGEFRTLAEQRLAEIEALKAQHHREMLHRDADHALLEAGIKHPALRKGYVSEWLADPERKPLSEWAESIKTDPMNAPLLSQVPAAPPVGAGPSAGAAARAGVSKSLEQLQKELASTDARISTAARTEIRALRAAGKLPAGV
jgi:hypothetical protein